MSAELEPELISVKEAAKFLGGIAEFTIYRELDRKTIASQYIGRRRMVVVESLRAYRAGLPTTAPEPDDVSA